MNRELIKEINANIYVKNLDELEDCFDEGLASDGGEYWVLGNKIIDALTEKGYIIIKTK